MKGPLLRELVEPKPDTEDEGAAGQWLVTKPPKQEQMSEA